MRSLVEYELKEFGSGEDHFTCVYGVGFPRLIHLGNSLWGNLIPSRCLCPTQTDVYLSETRQRQQETSKWPSPGPQKRLLAPCDLLILPLPGGHAKERGALTARGSPNSAHTTGVSQEGSRDTPSFIHTLSL